MDLALLTDSDMRRRFGNSTYERGRQYADSGHVEEWKHVIDDDGDLQARGQIAGSRNAPYTAYVAAGLDSEGLWFTSRCDCPMTSDCKHVVALLLTVRAELEGGGRDPTAASDGRWERLLAPVLDELDDEASRAIGTPGLVPLGLQIDITQRHRSRSTYGRWDVEGRSERRLGQGVLRIRPVKRGARDKWVKSGVSFQDLPGMGYDRSFDRSQVEALREVLALYRGGAAFGYYGGEAQLTLDAFGRSLWTGLARIERTGMPFVAGPGLDDVHVCHEPVRLQLDVNAADGSGSHLRLGVEHEGTWYSGEALELIGQPGHGAALWTPGARADRWVVTLVPLDRPVGPQLRRLVTAAEDLVVPRGALDDLVGDYLPRLQRHVTVVSSDGSVTVPEPVAPRLAATVTWLAADEVRLAWTWRYRVGGSDRVYGLSETRGIRGVRRPELERDIVMGLALTDQQIFHLCDGHRLERGLCAERTFTHDRAVGFAEELLPTLEALAADRQIELDEVGGRPDYRESSEAPVIRFAPRDPSSAKHQTRTDWLDLEVVISVDGQHLALARLLEALTLGHARVVMPNGVHIRLDRPEFTHLAELVQAARELHDQPREGMRVGSHDLGLWEELAELGIVDAQAAQWAAAAQALRGLTTLPEVEPIGVKAELRHYQIEGFRWLAFLWESRLGGILADDMGLGKTLQTLALVAYARDRGAGPFLVVAPTSVVSTWAHEAAQFCPGLVVRTVTQAAARRGASIPSLAEGADLLITSYTLFRLESDEYVDGSWGGLVLDEAQMVKNFRGKTHQSIRRVEAPFRVALTGTPMENRLMELWALLSIVAPGLYSHPTRFKELVANPVEREHDAAALERFRRRIRPFLLRRTKELVAADLPPKQEQVLDVALTPRHRRIYDTHLQRERQTVLGLVGDFEKHRIAIFRSLTRLRQLSLDPALVDPRHDSVGSAKLDVLVDHLTEIMAEGHRALVFSQFTSYLRRVRERLDREGIGSTYLDGRTRRRHEVIDAFKRGEGAVFLISLKAGGTGLTLTEADYVFVLDPWWNPAVEAQAVDRAHRIGQRNPVMVYRLVSEDTIEEKVMELKARKAALFAKVVDGEGGAGTPISAADVRALFDD